MLSLDHFRSVVASLFGRTLDPVVATLIEQAALQLPVAPVAPIDFGCVAHHDYIICAAKLADNFDAIHALHLLHWRETEQHRHALPLTPRYDLLLQREATGAMHQFIARDTLTGHIAAHIRMNVSASPQTSQLIAHEDALFLHPAHRPNAFLMLALMRFAEDAMRKLGCVELECNSKAVNKADVLMRRLGYRPVATQFHKILKEHDHV